MVIPVMLSSGLIITFSILGAIIFGVGFFLLYHFVISRNNYKHQIKDLERKYSYLDALLIGQDSQYIHRLEIISHTNLLYVEKYNHYSRKFKEIFDGEDKFCESMLKQLNALVENRQFKNIKVVISDARKAIQVFENKVNQLDAELYTLIKPEEEARQAVLKLKENYRRVKQIYYANVSDLELVGPSFNQIFEKLDHSFNDFETHIESGEYEDATAIIPLISKVVSALDSSLTILPNLCILATSLIPSKIKELTNEYNEIEKQGVPLFNLAYRQKQEKWNYDLEKIRRKLVNLQTTGLMEELDAIQKEIDDTRDALHSEISDENDFNKNSDILYHKVIDLEKSFLKISSILPEIRKVYIIDNEHENKIEELREIMSQLVSSRRNLDNFINSAIKQPYSVLKKKLDELNHDYLSSYTAVQSFKTYLDSLKKDSEEAYSMVFIYYYHCRQIESLLRQLNIPNFAEQYDEKIQNIYVILNEIDVALKTRPIDVNYVNERAEQLKTLGNDLFDEIENKYREAQLAESAIVYDNRDRVHQKDVHQQLLVLEEQFFMGDFLTAYHEANSLFKRMHVEESPNAR